MRIVGGVSEHRNLFNDRQTHTTLGIYILITFLLFAITGCFDFGKDYHPGGNNIDVVASIFTPTACQEVCQKLPACKYWTFNENNNKCIRKGSKPSTPSDVSYATSGPKYCPDGKVV